MKLFTKIMICFALSIPIISAYGQTAQTSSKSMVFLTEEDIVSLTKTLKKYKKAKKETQSTLIFTNEPAAESTVELNFLRQQIEQLENQLETPVTSKSKVIKKSDRLIEDEIKELQIEVAELKGMIYQLVNTTTNNSKPTAITIPSQKQIATNQPEVTTPDILNNKNDQLNKRIDSLNAILKSIENKNDPNYTAHFENLQLRLQNLKNEITAKKVEPATNEEFKINYRDYKRQLFFENNSKKVNEAQLPIIDELAQIVASNSSVDIYIKGFASNKGKISTNETISLQRTEAVKKLLVNKGIHPTRILTQYHGIDYQATSESLARRVDIEFLIRK